MNYPVNCEALSAETEYYSEVLALQQEATLYLKSFTWCKKVINSLLYTNIGKVFCIFLYEIENTVSNEDNFLWIVVGDIPPMYLDIHGPKTTKEVIEIYIGLADDWIETIREGKTVNNCFPFNAEPTLQMAELLEKKTSFMKDTLLDNIDDIALVNL